MKLSGYVLTFNSEKHLRRVLEPLRRVADELIVLDSGSSDATLDIARQCGAAVYCRAFDDFIRQRDHAVSLCRYDWILYLDSDEILDESLVETLLDRKHRGLGADGHDAYAMRRDWYVLGRYVHNVYPVKYPDYVIRLYRKDVGRFDATTPVHEKLGGYRSLGRLEPGAIRHLTFETREEFERKLAFYPQLSVQTLLRRGRARRVSRAGAVLHAWGAFLKAWLLHRGWRDGWVGVLCARYAYRYTLAKYLGLRRAQDG